MFPGSWPRALPTARLATPGRLPHRTIFQDQPGGHADGKNAEHNGGSAGGVLLASRPRSAIGEARLLVPAWPVTVAADRAGVLILARSQVNPDRRSGTVVLMASHVRSSSLGAVRNLLDLECRSRQAAAAIDLMSVILAAYSCGLVITLGWFPAGR